MSAEAFVAHAVDGIEPLLPTAGALTGATSDERAGLAQIGEALPFRARGCSMSSSAAG